MTPRILYTNDSGGVSVVVPAPDSGLTLEQVIAKAVPRGVEYEVVDAADLPTDRTYRNAWRRNGSAVQVDMPAARDIQRDRLRAERAPLLASLDVEYQRADERADPDEKQRIAARKQVLRDVTADPRIEAARTPDELKALTLDVLTA